MLTVVGQIKNDTGFMKANFSKQQWQISSEFTQFVFPAKKTAIKPVLQIVCLIESFLAIPKRIFYSAFCTFLGLLAVAYAVPEKVITTARLVIPCFLF